MPYGYIPNNYNAYNLPQYQQPMPQQQQSNGLIWVQGIAIPEGMENNPQGIIQHLMQSGRVTQNRLTMAQQMMQRMFRR